MHTERKLYRHLALKTLIAGAIESLILATSCATILEGTLVGGSIEVEFGDIRVSARRGPEHSHFPGDSSSYPISRSMTFDVGMSVSCMFPVVLKEMGPPSLVYFTELG